MKPFAIAGNQNESYQQSIPMWKWVKLKLDDHPWIYLPLVEMVVFSELCAYGPLTPPCSRNFQIFEQRKQNHGPKNTTGFYQESISWKKNMVKFTNTASVITSAGRNCKNRYSKNVPFLTHTSRSNGRNEFCVLDATKCRVALEYPYMLDIGFPETIPNTSQ